MSEEITWDLENGGGQSLGGLIDGFTEFMITYDFRKEERPFYARYGIEVVSGDGYYETLTDAKKACEDHWEEEIISSPEEDALTPYEKFIKNPPSAEELLDDPSLDPRFYGGRGK